MHRFSIAGAVVFFGALAAQQPASPKPAPPKFAAPKPAAPKPEQSKPKPQPASMQNVQFDPGNGWPVGADEGAPPAAPAAESARTARPPAGAPAGKGRGDGGASPRAAVRPPAPPEGEPAPQLASGTQLGSPLLDIYQATQGPGVWKQVGGVVVQWRITIHGALGEEIGVREITHTADTAFAERDRVEYTDGRTFGRLGAQVYAERGGMPMPTLTEQAGQELMLFGLQLRLPWLFGDANAFAVVGKDVEERGGERLRKVVVEQRPPAGLDVNGPELDPRPRDRYEVLYEPTSGLPREFVHRFASSMQTRRVLLEDWREPAGIAVKLPHRRVYVDEAMRPTTTLEILRIERQRVSERDFRLL